MVFKKNTEKEILQEIYDYNFKQLELSIREMGYGDVAINKKMKTYLNIFHAILDKIDNWENLSDFETTAFSNTYNVKPEITYSFSNSTSFIWSW